MNKAQEILFESLGSYGFMKDKLCKLKFDEHGNPNINIASLYPSVMVNMDDSHIVDQYKTKDGKWVIEIDV